MSDIQRWDMFAEVGINEPVKYDMWEAVEGRYVLYADHVAAVAAAEQRGAIAGVQEMAAVRPFKATDLFGIDPDFVAAPSDYEQGFAAAVGKCRDAVAAMRPETDPDIAHVIVSDVLDAIDGVGKP